MSLDTESTSKRICKLVYEVRRARGITQNDLSKRLGLSQPHLSKIENELAIPTIVQWLQFCQLFSVPGDVILDETRFNQFLAQVRLGDLAATDRSRQKSHRAEAG